MHIVKLHTTHCQKLNKEKVIHQKGEAKYKRSHFYSSTIFINIKTQEMHQQHTKELIDLGEESSAQSQCCTVNLTFAPEAHAFHNDTLYKHIMYKSSDFIILLAL